MNFIKGELQRQNKLGMDHYLLLGGGEGGGYHFWDLQTIFLESNAFQTIFFITFCNENNFCTTIFKNVTGFFIDLF